MKLAPDASAITSQELAELRAVGRELRIQSGSVVGEGWPFVHAVHAVVHDDVGHVALRRQACRK